MLSLLFVAFRSRCPVFSSLRSPVNFSRRGLHARTGRQITWDNIKYVWQPTGFFIYLLPFNTFYFYCNLFCYLLTVSIIATCNTESYLLQDRFDLWVIKRATSLSDSFCGNLLPVVPYFQPHF